MAKRTGIPTLHKLAIRMCTVLAKFAPIIVLLYPSNTLLHAALTAAQAACAELAAQLVLVRDYGD